MPATKWIEADAYIFDIDGTLLNAYGGAHYNAFHAALKKHFDLDCKIDGVPLHGNTDVGIIRAVLAREGLMAGEFDARRQAMLTDMCDEVERNRQQIRAELCPGIPQLLAQLASKKKLLGIATGNLERIGWLKMETAGIKDHFRFGAFSDRHETREDIFRDAAQQARNLGGDAISLCFVGDTPHDVTAARTLGIPCVAVTTGNYTTAQLDEHSPDMCIGCFDEILPYLPA